ncbi:uncharacterized protein [Primulina huaijiensis]|uniref:uncharacterized protein n=1 Tax=Primulina huaijiensis TaxID=1492673 RepID=UPI003CC6E87C
MSWLINSMTTEISENFLLCTTAKDIWEAARDTYSSKDNTSELFAVESNLQDLRQGDLTVTVYFNSLTRLWQQIDLFKTHEWKYPDDEVHHEESRRKVMLGPLVPPLSVDRSALATQNHLFSAADDFGAIRPPQTQMKTGRPWCSKCRKPTHTLETYWKIRGKPVDWKPARERRANAAVTEEHPVDQQPQQPFTKEQLELL